MKGLEWSEHVFGSTRANNFALLVSPTSVLRHLCNVCLSTTIIMSSEHTTLRNDKMNVIDERDLLGLGWKLS